MEKSVKYDVTKMLEKLERLPANWRNIKNTLERLIVDGYVEYQWYYPRGKASRYMGYYNNIWDNLDRYAKMVGLKIKYVPGSRGGRWTSMWVLE
jgi:hypothetical protein